MADVDVKLNLRGLNAIMTSPAVSAVVEERARRIAAAAGDGFEVVIRPHKYTARAYVQTATWAARRREAKEKVLNRALDAGR